MRLEGVISEEQLDIIRLAFIGLDIRTTTRGTGSGLSGWLENTQRSLDRSLDTLYDRSRKLILRSARSNNYLLDKNDQDMLLFKRSFSELCMELSIYGKMDDVPYLLYVVLVGVGVDILLLEEVGFDCDTEIDIKFLHQNYPKFRVLLAVGNMVMSMSDNEFERFCRNYSWGRDDVSAYRFSLQHRSSIIVYLIGQDELFNNKWRSFGFDFASYIRDYFDSLKAPRALQKNAQRDLEEGMEEGYVSLNNIKMVICGPPFVGKTAFKHLLLNKPPPLKHNSTPIARPIRAIERIAAGDNTWEEANEEDLLHMLSDAITKKSTQSLQEEYSTTATISDQIKSNDEISSSKHVVLPAINSVSFVLPPSTQKNSLLSVHEPSAVHEPSLQEPSLQEPSLQEPSVHKPSLQEPSELEPSLQESSVHEPSFHEPVHGPFVHGAEVINDDHVSRKIIKQLSLNKIRKRSNLLEATWIHLLDSGGQPQFTNLLRMFMRDNSLYIIVMKVTESLHDKPMFVYSLNGSPLSVPQEISMTNLQIIESFVRSVAVASRYKTTKPAFAIVATYCDCSKFRRFIGLDEKLKTKNKVIQKCLSEFLDLFIFYNLVSDELIFPVDNLCRWNRQKITADIRSRLLCSHFDISFNVKIPIRWYVFDLNMKKEASKETHGIISIESCFNIGRKLFGMNKSEVKHCLNYLDSMRLCVYYPTIIPRVIFTSPQFLIDCLSNIVRVSFVDDLQQILPEGVSLSEETVLSLKRDGVFDESLLDNLGLTFLPNLFSKSDLLSLLQHFRLISPIKAARDVHQYFIPVLLPAERLTEVQKAIFGSSLDPLIITFKGQLVLQVSNKFITLSSYIIVFLYRDCFRH